MGEVSWPSEALAVISLDFSAAFDNCLFDISSSSKTCSEISRVSGLTQPTISFLLSVQDCFPRTLSLPSIPVSDDRFYIYNKMISKQYPDHLGKWQSCMSSGDRYQSVLNAGQLAQGSPLSPILWNLYLLVKSQHDPLFSFLFDHGIVINCYADNLDFVVPESLLQPFLDLLSSVGNNAVGIPVKLEQLKLMNTSTSLQIFNLFNCGFTFMNSSSKPLLITHRNHEWVQHSLYPWFSRRAH